MKFSGKMCLKMILKFTKNYGFTLSLEDTLFKIQFQDTLTTWGGRLMLIITFTKIFFFFEYYYGMK